MAKFYGLKSTCCSAKLNDDRNGGTRETMGKKGEYEEYEDTR